MRCAIVYLALSLCLIAAPALAQDDDSGVAGRYRHDGFYLRLSIGPSAHYTLIETNRSVDPEVRVTGASIAGDVLVGGTPIPGLVIGGGVVGDIAPAPQVEVGDQETSGDFESWTRMVGVYDVERSEVGVTETARPSALALLFSGVYH